MPQFMKEFKQRISMWYNREYDHKGSFFTGRYWSAMVEGAWHRLVGLPAYVDLNPVRAELVEDPKDYRFSGYGRAVKFGDAMSLRGIKTWMQQDDAQKALAHYRHVLYSIGAKPKKGGKVALDPQEGRHEPSAEQGILGVDGTVGSIGIKELTQNRIVRSGVVGSEAFVEAMECELFAAGKVKQRRKPIVLKNAAGEIVAAVLKRTRRARRE